MCQKKVWLSLGSNVEDGYEKLTEALAELGEIFTGIRYSSIYKTEALNKKDADYFNCVAEIKTDLDSEYLKVKMKEIERKYGRNEYSKQKGRIEMDIDVVVYDAYILREKDYERDYFQYGYNELKMKDL